MFYSSNNGGGNVQARETVKHGTRVVKRRTRGLNFQRNSNTPNGIKTFRSKLEDFQHEKPVKVLRNTRHSELSGVSEKSKPVKVLRNTRHSELSGESEKSKPVKVLRNTRHSELSGVSDKLKPVKVLRNTRHSELSGVSEKSKPVKVLRNTRHSELSGESEKSKPVKVLRNTRHSELSGESEKSKPVKVLRNTCHSELSGESDELPITTRKTTRKKSQPVNRKSKEPIQLKLKSSNNNDIKEGKRHHETFSADEDDFSDAPPKKKINRKNPSNNLHKSVSKKENKISSEKIVETRISLEDLLKTKDLNVVSPMVHVTSSVNQIDDTDLDKTIDLDDYGNVSLDGIE